MKQKIYQLACTKHWQYNCVLHEIIAQKNLFPSELAYTQILVKYQAIVNRLQGVINRHRP